MLPYGHREPVKGEAGFFLNHAPVISPGRSRLEKPLGVNIRRAGQQPLASQISLVKSSTSPPLRKPSYLDVRNNSDYVGEMAHHSAPGAPQWQDPGVGHHRQAGSALTTDRKTRRRENPPIASHGSNFRVLSTLQGS